MFGVRIVAFVAALLGVTAIMPLDLAEARPRYSSEGSYAKHLRTSYAKAHLRKSYAKHPSRKSYAKYGAGKSSSRQATRRSYAHAGRNSSTRTRSSTTPIRVAASARASAGVGPRPARWCGWWMRTQLGGGPELNLARNWKSWGRASGPQVGAVVVWAHHVGIITGRSDSGQWIVKSGNDGGRVRERPRSVAGAVFRVA
ncbi:MAG TPA: hypothetical protein VFO09_03920 [Methyloceanibacter sp.]|jgi:hypothetical protein|nr:hypothetical protein [Methyloceanibacter sp.]